VTGSPRGSGQRDGPRSRCSRGFADLDSRAEFVLASACYIRSKWLPYFSISARVAVNAEVAIKLLLDTVSLGAIDSLIRYAGQSTE